MEYKLTDLVEKDILQQLQNIVVMRSGIPVGISDDEGNPITDSTEELCAFCELYTKKTEIGYNRCRQCDINNAKIAAKSGHVSAYRCHAGLIDFTAPILLNDKLLGFIIGGQISTEPLGEDMVRNLAVGMDIDPGLYWAAAQRIKIVDKYKMNELLNLADNVATLVSNMARTKYQLLEATREVEAAARMKSDFLANMSHEIRTPMNAVIGMADMALREELPPIAKNYIGQIKSSGKSLLAIINDILDFSKIDSGKMDINEYEYSPYDLFAEVANVINTRIGMKPVELIFDISENVPARVIGDANRVKQIIINITNNAAKFTNEGSITLAVDCVQKSEDMVEFLYSVTDTGIGIKEEDMGKLFGSFTQVDSKRNRNVEGTGLGLAITKNLLSLMNGSISLSSEYGKGSCFAFVIPQKIDKPFEPRTIEGSDNMKAVIMISSETARNQLAKDLDRFGVGNCSIQNIEDYEKFPDANYLFIDGKNDLEVVKNMVSKRQNAKVILILDYQDDFRLMEDNIIVVRKPIYSHILYRIFSNQDVLQTTIEDEEKDAKFTAPNAHVLIVDDNSVNLTVAKGLLRPLNMHVDTADSGKRCLDMIAEQKYNIIFMDHMMPEMDGVETTRCIRRLHQEYANTPIIALSANAVAEARALFESEGMNDFIAKPIEVNAFLNMVRKWLPDELIVEDDGTGAGGADDSDEVEFISYLKSKNFDTDKALGMLGGEEIYKEILGVYFGTIKDKDNVILNSWENLDWSTFTIEVHAVKSSSRQIGALELGDLAEKLEMAGKSEDIETVQNNISQFFKMRNEIFEVLDKICAVDEQEGDKEYNREEVMESLTHMLEASDDLDISGMEREAEKLAEFSFPEDVKPLWTQLKKAVEEMDFEVAEEVINKWQSEF